MKERLGLVILTALSLSACNEQNDNVSNVNTGIQSGGRSLSVIGHLRPKADPSVIQQIHQEEADAERRRQEEAERQARAAQEQSGNGDSPYGRNLPDVNTGPIASTSDSGSFYGNSSGSSSAPMPSGSLPEPSQSWASPVASAPPPPPASSYGINYTTPSAGFVPPPPAVSLSAQGQLYGYGAPPPDYANPYANPYMQPPQQAAAPQRPKGSLFGGGANSGSSASDEEEDTPKRKKEKNFQVITPTGMEPRSPFKQRDDLKALWKGALASSLSAFGREEKFAEGLSKVEVALPTEASRGSLSVAQRQVDNLFKNAPVDRKIIAPVKKAQTDLVQAYYRYLYAYNKFYLTQQQVAARKQELELAESQAEKQRATVDLAQSQQEADASKDDLRSSQGDLASIVGAQTARTVITKVSGVSPTLESLASAEQSAGDAQQGGDGGIGGFMGSIGNAFGFGGKKSKAEPEEVQVATEDKGKERKEKEKKEKKGKGAQPVALASKPQQDSAPSSKADAVESAAPAQASPSGPVSFELKDVKTTPHKTMLRVVVKNVGGDNFSFDADSVSVAEGNTKLTEAAVRAEFDSTMVQPNGEVTGTITIYGRPWNDKLSVSLSDGAKPILMHR
ncbi:MAG: hypothetical protein K2X77_23205 [Candidatus Obscuribacterales bacterium]|nr:hypothetical protein [Candidatus Obscuribacterales bacterium]